MLEEAGAEKAKQTSGDADGRPRALDCPRPAAARRPTERAVTAALVWLANHQSSDGSWSLQNYNAALHGQNLHRHRQVPADAGATAMGLLPFLAAGQTHKSKGPYKEHILKGIEWLIRHQQPDGNLAKGAQQMMYSHGLATIALSEAYGLTRRQASRQGRPGGGELHLAAQNAADGGWRYNPKDPGDTSVLRLAVDGLEERTHGRAERRRRRSSPAPASGWIPSPYTTAPNMPTSPAVVLRPR